MSESIATRVPESTAEALGAEANDRDESVSSVAADVLEQWADDDGDDSDSRNSGSVAPINLPAGDGDSDDDPDRHGGRDRRIADLESDIEMVAERCRRLTDEQRAVIMYAEGVTLTPRSDPYPPLPGDDSGNSDRPDALDELGI